MKCKACNGTGAGEGKYGQERCPVCNGTGLAEHNCVDCGVRTDGRTKCKDCGALLCKKCLKDGWGRCYSCQ